MLRGDLERPPQCLSKRKRFRQSTVRRTKFPRIVPHLVRRLGWIRGVGWLNNREAADKLLALATQNMNVVVHQRRAPSCSWRTSTTCRPVHEHGKARREERLPIS